MRRFTRGKTVGLKERLDGSVDRLKVGWRVTGIGSKTPVAAAAAAVCHMNVWLLVCFFKELGGE
ncbi:unnamed protein product [Ectocarpus sp. CCAP 1310/34]|nr:unnamed protein product [Ectocarpus sp. CCAP 1310/34]